MNADKLGQIRTSLLDLMITIILLIFVLVQDKLYFICPLKILCKK